MEKINVVFRAGRDGRVVGKQGGRFIFLDRKNTTEIFPGECWICIVTGQSGNARFVVATEKVEPRMASEALDGRSDLMTNTVRGYGVVEHRTNKNIKNSFGGGFLVGGADFWAYPYLYGDPECSEPVSYGQHGRSHYLYELVCLPGTPQAERREIQAKKFAEIEEARKAEETRLEARRLEISQAWDKFYHENKGIVRVTGMTKQEFERVYPDTEKIILRGEALKKQAQAFFARLFPGDKWETVAEWAGEWELADHLLLVINRKEDIYIQAAKIAGTYNETNRLVRYAELNDGDFGKAVEILNREKQEV